MPGGRLASAVLAASLALTAGAAAGPPDDAQLVRDVNPGPPDSRPEELTRVGQKLFFTADGPDGVELWVFDGATGQTGQVQDINPGPADSDPEELTESGGLLFFRARDASGDTELWVSDATKAGTHRVKDIDTSASSFPNDLADVNDRLFFRADDGMTGRELWASDGTSNGTEQVADLNLGPGNSDAFNLTGIGDKLYFAGTSGGGSNYEPWISDGTPGGTQQITDIGVGGGSLPRDFTEMGGVVYFTAGAAPVSAPAETDRELYRTDGTDLGTSRVKDIATGTDCGCPTQLTVIGDTLYFAAGTGPVNTPPPPRNEELWRSDGTEDGTEMVKDINPGIPSSNPASLVAAGGRLFFGARDPDDGDGALFVSDGTDVGTEKISDHQVVEAGAFDGDLVATLYDGADEAELWRSDGTAAGTVLVEDINDGALDPDRVPMEFTSLGRAVYFSAGDEGNGIELWKALDATAPETKFDSGPQGGATTSDRRPTHTFGSDDPPSTFECRITAAGEAAGAFGPCSGPGDAHRTPLPLADGTYTLEVRASDAAGNVDVTPAAATFTVGPALAQPPTEPDLPCQNVLRGNGGKNRLVGTDGPDQILGFRGDDKIFGRAGDDCLFGHRGDDKIKGGAGDDAISAGSGRDGAVGGPGEDFIKTGLNDDWVKVRDGERDVVNCGPGHDTVKADRLDKLHKCERVKRPRKR